MKKSILILVSILLTGTVLTAQTKVANYSFGKPGTDKYEHFDFWTKEGRRTEINYAYGENRKEVKLRYLGKDAMNGRACFKVGFANNYVLYIVPTESGLQVSDATGKYNKVFSWEYEGPVNGVGTFCDVCAEDKEEAIKIVHSSFLN